MPHTIIDDHLDRMTREIKELRDTLRAILAVPHDYHCYSPKTQIDKMRTIAQDGLDKG